MSSRLQKLDGIRTKFRTTEDGSVTATVWIDGEQKLEIARLDASMLHHPGDPEYHAWVDAVTALFNAWLGRIAGGETFHGKRERPDYKGE